MAEKKVEVKEAPKMLAKTVHMYAGVDLMGSKTSIVSKEAELEVVSYGVIMTSKKKTKEGNYRCILIPFSNVKGIELFPTKGKPNELPAT